MKEGKKERWYEKKKITYKKRKERHRKKTENRGEKERKWIRNVKKTNEWQKSRGSNKV